MSSQDVAMLLKKTAGEMGMAEKNIDVLLNCNFAYLQDEDDVRSLVEYTMRRAEVSFSAMSL